jgi:hypothetical protein
MGRVNEGSVPSSSLTSQTWTSKLTSQTWTSKLTSQTWTSNLLTPPRLMLGVSGESGLAPRERPP